MRIKTLFIAATFCLALPAAAQEPPALEAYEVEIGDLRLPTSTDGTLGFKGCDDCPWQVALVTADTVYEANGRQYTLEAFRAGLEGIPQDRHATVMHDSDTNTVKFVRARF